MGTTLKVLPVAVLVGVIALLLGGSAALLGYFGSIGPNVGYRHVALPLAVGGAWLAFAGALLLLRRVPRRAASALVLVGAVVIGGAALAGPPNTSTDSARYAWDGIVQTHGISPYEYAPASPALASLRPEWLFPAPVRDAEGHLHCVGPRIQTVHEPGTGALLCTALNRATARTIYPPAAELLFAGVRLAVGPDATYWPLQVLGLLLSLAVTVVLLRALRRRDLDPRWAALWAWCPLVATEAVTNSHIDVLGALLLLAATLAASSAGTVSTLRSGLALGLATSVKLVPAIGTPALLGRRGSWRIVGVAVLVFALLYVPYVLASGIRVLGYLPTYLTDEGYRDGKRFDLLQALPGQAALVVAVVILAITAFLVWRKTDAGSPFTGQLAMIGITLLVVSPRYPWYGLLLVPMIAMTGRPEWFGILLALSVRQYVLAPYSFLVPLLLATVAIAVGSALRAGPGWSARLRAELRHPWRRPGRLPLPSPSVDA